MLSMDMDEFKLKNAGINPRTSCERSKCMRNLFSCCIIILS